MFLTGYTENTCTKVLQSFYKVAGLQPIGISVGLVFQSPEGFLKKGALRNFSKFTENTFIKKEASIQVFSCDFAKFVRTPFLIENLQWLLLFLLTGGDINKIMY